MASVEDVVVEGQIATVKEIAEHRGWPFEHPGCRCFRISLIAGNGDAYQLEVNCEGFPVEPAAFHWRNPQTGDLDKLADAPARYGYFHKSGRICAPWNRLASEPGGPHTDWKRANWREQPETQGTTTLPAMVLRINRELRSKRYRGRYQ